MADRINIGVTTRGAQHLADLMATGWFLEQLDAFRVAIGVALGYGVCTPPEDMGGGGTKWNIGSVDNDGRLRQLIMAVAPASGDRPYEYAERLADAGLALLGQRLVRDGALLFEVLGGPQRQDKMVAGS
jgi:hypothetical protein